MVLDSEEEEKKTSTIVSSPYGELEDDKLLYRISQDNSHKDKSFVKSQFNLICEVDAIAVNVMYSFINKKFTLEAGSFQYEVVRALFSNGNYLLPYKFTQEEYNLHYRIDLNADKDGFTMKVNN